MNLHDTTENIPNASNKMHCLRCGREIVKDYNSWLHIRMLCRRCYHLLENRDSLVINYRKDGSAVFKKSFSFTIRKV